MDDMSVSRHAEADKSRRLPQLSGGRRWQLLRLLPVDGIDVALAQLAAGRRCSQPHLSLLFSQTAVAAVEGHRLSRSRCQRQLPGGSALEQRR